MHRIQVLPSHCGSLLLHQGSFRDLPSLPHLAKMDRFNLQAAVMFEMPAQAIDA